MPAKKTSKDSEVLTLQVHRGREHGGPVDVLYVRSGPHNSALRSRRTGMMHPHATGPRCRIVGPCHGGGGRRIPIRRLRHLATRGQVAVRAGHVTQTGGVHPRALKAAGLEALIQVRVVHAGVKT